jgi:RiboL-PSP-HEPN
MPSRSLQIFYYNLLNDINQLIKIHDTLNKGKGRKSLGHLTRSGVVLLCAAWEVYIEEVLVEAANYLKKNTINLTVCLWLLKK